MRLKRSKFAALSLQKGEYVYMEMQVLLRSVEVRVAVANELFKSSIS